MSFLKHSTWNSGDVLHLVLTYERLVIGLLITATFDFYLTGQLFF